MTTDKAAARKKILRIIAVSLLLDLVSKAHIRFGTVAGVLTRVDSYPLLSSYHCFQSSSNSTATTKAPISRPTVLPHFCSRFYLVSTVTRPHFHAQSIHDMTSSCSEEQWALYSRQFSLVTMYDGLV
jgi:hypothetical protein